MTLLATVEISDMAQVLANPTRSIGRVVTGSGGVFLSPLALETLALFLLLPSFFLGVFAHVLGSRGV